MADAIVFNLPTYAKPFGKRPRKSSMRRAGTITLIHDAQEKDRLYLPVQDDRWILVGDLVKLLQLLGDRI